MTTLTRYFIFLTVLCINNSPASKAANVWDAKKPPSSNKKLSKRKGKKRTMLLLTLAAVGIAVMIVCTKCLISSDQSPAKPVSPDIDPGNENQNLAPDSPVSTDSRYTNLGFEAYHSINFENCLQVCKENQDKIEFDRDKMTHIIWPKDIPAQVEGYWKTAKDNDEDFNKNYPFPQAHPNKFPGQDAWVSILASIERYIFEKYKPLKPLTPIYLASKDEKNSTFFYQFCMGISPCRLCKPFQYVSNGSITFAYVLGGDDSKIPQNTLLHKPKIMWPQGFRHYVEKHNVIPSEEFYDFILQLGKKHQDLFTN